MTIDILKLSAGIILGAILSVVVALSNGCSSPHAERCERMEAIALDPDKIAYLRGWVEERLSDEEFLSHMGSLGQSNAIDDKTHFLKLGLDTEFLGIDEQYGFVRLHRPMKQGEISRIDSSISSVSIGEGRSGIVIVLDGRGDANTEEIAAPNQIRTISEDVLVFCR